MARRPNRRAGDSYRLANEKRRRGKRAPDPEKQKKDRLGKLMIAGVLSVAIMTAAFWILQEDINYDEAGCVTDKPLDRHVIYLIDGTDKITGTDLKRLKDSISESKDSLKVSDKFSITQLSGDADGNPVFEEIFSLCNPGQGKQFKGIMESKLRKQAEWNQAFQGPLTSALDALQKLETGDSTPLLESLLAISKRRDFKADVSQRELVIVSDLLHHTPEFSQYAASYSYDAYAKLGSPYMGVDLSGAKLNVIYIKRKGLNGYQSKNHQTYWKRFFGDSGATSATFD